jgi:hypothetical protein
VGLNHAGDVGYSGSQMKRYRTSKAAMLHGTYKECNHDVGIMALSGRVEFLRPATKFIVLESIGSNRNIVSGDQVGWIWLDDKKLAYMEVTES